MLMLRYVESLVYQGVVENIASRWRRGWWP